VSAGLVGRDQELGACEELFGQARRQGGSLLFRGSAGIGKTALLAAARARADAIGFRVLSTAGSQAETAFAFVGLQPLLLPVVDEAAALPEHLKAALLSALGLLDAEIPALETVGLAVLGLLAVVASEDAPLCVVIDDLHWLDASSAGVLRFVARRLGADPVVLLAAGREGGWVPPGVLPEMPLEPLGRVAAEAVLASSASALSGSARSRVLEEAQGNPLALVELPRALGSSLRDPARGLPQVLPMTARLEASFSRRTDLLQEDSKVFLLAAALAPTASLSELLSAAGAVVGHPVELMAQDHKELSALVELDRRRVDFRHPLMRSGLVHVSPVSQLQATHQALAGVLTDAGRRLHHRAAASTGPDDGLADELDQGARLALRRGSPATAVALLEQAAELTVRGPRRDARLLRAAQLSFELGQAGESRRLLAGVDGDVLDRADGAAARLLGLALDGLDSDDPRPVWELIALAEEAIAAGDGDSALRLLEFGSVHVAWGTPGRDVGRAVVATSRRVPAFETEPRAIALLAQALPVEGHLELADRLARVDEDKLADAESQRLVGFAAGIAGDYERSARLLDRAERELRRQARLALLAAVLTFRGVAAFGCGEWLLAEQVLDEAERLADETSQPAWRNRARQMRAGVAGMRQDEELHRRIVEEQVVAYQRTGAPHRHNHLSFMQGITAVMLGRVDDGLALLGGLFEPEDPIFDARTCYEAFFFLADAASAAGRPDVVQRAVDVMGVTVPAPWPPTLQSGVDYARAVTASDAEVGKRLETVLVGLVGGRAFDRARVQLAYGRWLRRNQQRLQAREQLRAALGTFDRLGNEPFAHRARAELRAAGQAGPPRRGFGSGTDRLSPQEAQIAGLVAEGLSNKEIGERLFLSPRTVASHLYRVFPKLGITSRAQLAAVLRSR